MNTKWSLYIGQFSGIKVFIHWTFWILVVWIFFMHYNAGHGFNAALMGVLFIFALFACVVLHEFGHALTAQRFHIQTKNIMLYPIGGVANLEKMPEKPGQELLVAIAGPLVNVVIAVVLLIYLKAAGGIPSMEELKSMQHDQMMTGQNFSFNLFAVNVILFAFNLIPAFPMDGGRVLRALLAYRMERSKATAIAARIGQLLAIVFVLLGFFGNFWLVFIGVFIYLGAGGEATYEATKSALSGYKVKDIIMSKFTVLRPTDTLGKAVNLLLDGQEREFLVGEDNHINGVLTRKEIIKGLHELGKDAPVANVMRKDFLVFHPDMDLQEVHHKMMSNGYSFGPVYDDSSLVGVVDKENISELIMVNEALKK